MEGGKEGEGRRREENVVEERMQREKRTERQRGRHIRGGREKIN